MARTRLWLLHAAILAAGIAVCGLITFADTTRVLELRIDRGVLAAIFWIAFACYAVITTALVWRAKDAGRVIAAHVIGMITAPAVAWLLAIACFGAFKGYEHGHPRAPNEHAP